MPVLVEANSVIIRVQAIKDKYPGGWKAFVGNVPNGTLCDDGELARVGFMAFPDCEAFVCSLEGAGLLHLNRGSSEDIAIAEQTAGLLDQCSWLEFSKVTLHNGNMVSAIRLKGSSSNQLFCPIGWEYENSLSKCYTRVPLSQMENYKFVRSEGGVGVYRDGFTGKEKYIGRTSADGRGERDESPGMPSVPTDPDAQCRLGITYASEGNETEALRLFVLAADRGHATAQYLLGRLYLVGQGINKDEYQAAKWFRKAADQNFGEAQFYLGVLYATGRGVPENSISAYMWFSLAVKNGYKDGIDSVERMKRKLGERQIALGDQLLQQWKEGGGFRDDEGPYAP